MLRPDTDTVTVRISFAPCCSHALHDVFGRSVEFGAHAWIADTRKQTQCRRANHSAPSYTYRNDWIHVSHPLNFTHASVRLRVGFRHNLEDVSTGPVYISPEFDVYVVPLPVPIL